MKRPLFLALIAATLIVYGVMVFWSLPALNLPKAMPFDLRPGGYSYADASDYLGRLSAAQVAFYHDVQHRLDLFFPALFGLTMFFSIAAASPRKFGAWRWVLAVIALPGMAFDYLENRAVSAMLDVGAAGLTPELVAEANQWTLLKSGASTVTMTLLLGLLLWKGFVAWRARVARA
jgi:hypothetical protein